MSESTQPKEFQETNVRATTAQTLDECATMIDLIELADGGNEAHKKEEQEKKNTNRKESKELDDKGVEEAEVVFEDPNKEVRTEQLKKEKDVEINDGKEDKDDEKPEELTDSDYEEQEYEDSYSDPEADIDERPASLLNPPHVDSDWDVD